VLAREFGRPNLLNRGGTNSKETSLCLDEAEHESRTSQQHFKPITIVSKAIERMGGRVGNPSRDAEVVSGWN
jgi:hypothetical protein